MPTLNFQLSDEEHQQAAELKDELGYTWPQFLAAATNALEEQHRGQQQDSRADGRGTPQRDGQHGRQDSPQPQQPESSRQEPHQDGIGLERAQQPAQAGHGREATSIPVEGAEEQQGGGDDGELLYASEAPDDLVEMFGRENFPLKRGSGDSDDDDEEILDETVSYDGTLGSSGGTPGDTGY